MLLGEGNITKELVLTLGCTKATQLVVFGEKYFFYTEFRKT